MYRTLLAGVLLLAAIPGSASAQPPQPPRAQMAFGGWVAPRDGAKAGVGGGLAADLGRGALALEAEASVTRRAGHNDWRALVGPKLRLPGSGRVTAYVHALAGALIRNGESGPAIMGGVGVDVRGSGRIGVRLQADVSHDKANGVYATGGRGSVWLVLR